MIKDLILVANLLDNKGLTKEADILDKIIKSAIVRDYVYSREQENLVTSAVAKINNPTGEPNRAYRSNLDRVEADLIHSILDTGTTVYDKYTELVAAGDSFWVTLNELFKEAEKDSGYRTGELVWYLVYFILGEQDIPLYSKDAFIDTDRIYTNERDMEAYKTWQRAEDARDIR